METVFPINEMRIEYCVDSDNKVKNLKVDNCHEGRLLEILEFFEIDHGG